MLNTSFSVCFCGCGEELEDGSSESEKADEIKGIPIHGSSKFVVKNISELKCKNRT